MQPKPGQRIELVAMPDDPNPIAAGSRGTVKRVRQVGLPTNGFLQVDVDWDNGRAVMLSVPPDQFRIIDD